MAKVEKKPGNSNLWFFQRTDLLLSLAFLGVLVVLLFPLPPMLLDVLLAANIAIAVMLLLITISAKKALDISVFPSLLLLMTLYRLSLNVGTTRLILLQGNAGSIVSTFGNFVVGGNLVVGLVIFLILVIIQFVVINKGSSRVSEVAARFTLDAMPGKQMAIDAELNNGAIDDAEAKERRRELAQEAEFYGAMDGASKFVSGDAIAGLIITAINLVGGVVIGMMGGLSFVEAITRFSILTVGDGLVTQVPALIIATTAGILVTKATSDSSLSTEIGAQAMANRRPLWIGAFIIGAIALIPGLPKLPFLVIAGGLMLLLWFVRPEILKPTSQEAEEAEEGGPVREELPVEAFVQTNRVSIEVGGGLIPLVEGRKYKSLSDRTSGLRRELTRDYGLWVPSIRICDNLQLPLNTYRFLVGGREVARGALKPDHLLAIDPGGTSRPLAGEDVLDPAFGLPAKWIIRSDRQIAELGNYTVVDPPTTLITHLGSILQKYAHELLSREDLQKLIERLKEKAPALVEEVRPDTLRMGIIHQVLISLLQERVPITDLSKILEAMLNHSPQVKDIELLTEIVRQQLGRSICDRFRTDDRQVRVAILDPRLEMEFREAIREGSLSLHPNQLQKLIGRLAEIQQTAAAAEKEVALLVDHSLRRPLRKAIERALPEQAVLAYREIPRDLVMQAQAMIRREEIHDEKDAAATSPHDVADQLEQMLAGSTA
ncbi:MAG: flagellar biosynthesis protein FlhA [bacterium]|nr:flagellar biosynthesis protein FlhA [bacterium]